jgi:DNA-binding NarL/FixJ family response regulator
MRVFIAEPFAHTRARLAEMLAGMPQAQVIGEADSVRAAVAAILAQRPDVALLALKLADGSAFDVIHEVHPREPDVAFYVLSNFESEPYRRYAERLGAAAFIDKSVGLGELREMLARPATLC